MSLNACCDGVLGHEPLCPGPTTFYADPTVTIHHADCLEILQHLESDSIDAVVSDPPYGLGFMGKEWDRIKQEASRPPSADVTDERFNNAFPRTGKGPAATAFDGVGFQAWCLEWVSECLRVLKPGGHMLAFGGTRTFHRLACAVEDAGFEVRDSIAWLYGSGFPKSLNLVSEAGERTGWGTALKPAFEPIVVGRKPLAGTVAANVAAHGTGALNIDGCRTATSDTEKAAINAKHAGMDLAAYDRKPGDSLNLSTNPIPLTGAKAHDLGRWPANVILDESQAEVLDEQSGEGQSRIGKPRGADHGDGWGMTATGAEYDDQGGASRFFYVAKADSAERVRVDGIAHPTVKPLDLMRWLVRLVTPVGGIVLEPFAGSGTTVEACILEGFQCVAIEREADYLPLIVQRIHRRRDPVAAIKATGDEGGLFDLLSEETA